MKNLILKYHFWVLGILGMVFGSCSTSMKTVEKDGAKKIYNLKYGDDKKNVMDVFLPQNSSEKPLVMIVHGGGWKLGRKEHMKMIQKMLLKNEIASANINYRLLKKNLTYKDQLKDLERAVEKSGEFIKSSNIKNQKIIILGESAGAHLSLLYGYKNPEKVGKIISLSAPTDFYSEKYLNSFYSRKSSLIFEMVVGEKFNRKNLSEQFKEASPIYNVTSVPTLIFQGGKDHLVNKNQGFALDSVLSKNNIPHQLVFMKNAGHLPRFFSKYKRDSIIFPNILNWIKN